MSGVTLLDKWCLLQAVAADRDLSAGATKVMLRLLYHHNAQTGQCSPSYATIADGAGMKRRQTIYAVQELEQSGWLKMERVKGGDPAAAQGFVTNTFHIAFDRVQDAPLVQPNARPPGALDCTPPGAEECTPPSALECTPPVHLSALPPVHYSAPKTGKQSGKRNREESPPTPSRFDEFWLAYPRKVGKDAARPVFERIIAAKKATPEDLIAGARRYAAERASEDPTFTKHPKTWLNSGGWNDEPAQQRAPQQVRQRSGHSFSATQDWLRAKAHEDE